MKKFIFIFSIFIFLSLSINTITTLAKPAKTLTQGIYNARDTNLTVGSPMTVKITSPNDKAIVMIIDSNQNIQELVRLNPESQEHVLKPLSYGYSIIVFGSNVIFS
jgi:hypothetical protein